MSVTNVQDEQIASDMDDIKKSVCRTEKEAALQTPDPFQLAQFNQLKGRLDNFENKQACAPGDVQRGQLQNSAWGRGRLHWRARPAGQPQHAALVPTGGRSRRGARGSCRPARCVQAQHAAGRGGRAPSGARPGEPRLRRDAHRRLGARRDAHRRTSAR